jgi:hypothetical protein
VAADPAVGAVHTPPGPDRLDGVSDGVSGFEAADRVTAGLGVVRLPSGQVDAADRTFVSDTHRSPRTHQCRPLPCRLAGRFVFIATVDVMGRSPDAL